MVYGSLEHGVGDTSLRTLAAGVGTSHRMLLYHFRLSRGLLAAVVESVELTERSSSRLLAQVELTGRLVLGARRRRGRHLRPAVLQRRPGDAGPTWAPGSPRLGPRRSPTWTRLGRPPEEAARVNLAVVRGLPLALALTGCGGRRDAPPWPPVWLDEPLT